MTLTTGRTHAPSTFLRRAVARPAVLGTPFATGPVLAAQVAALVPRSGTPTVVELGVGTGAVSVALRTRMAPRARYLGVELDPELCAHVQRNLPWLDVVQGDAAELPALLAREGIGQVDALVTSLPWTFLPREHRRSMFADAAAVLAPDGVFSALSLRTAPRQRVEALLDDLGTAFAEVRVGATVWRNPPPGRLVVCRQPRQASC